MNAVMSIITVLIVIALSIAVIGTSLVDGKVRAYCEGSGMIAVRNLHEKTAGCVKEIDRVYE